MLISALRSTFSKALRAGLVSAATIALVACSGDGPSDPGELPARFGSLVVTVSGLPTGALANVTVTGPGGFSRSVTATTTLTALAAGTYNISADDVMHEGATYSDGQLILTVTVAAGATVNAPDVVYFVATGSLDIAVAGLPQSAPAAQVVINGPEGFTQTVAGSTRINFLKPGTYSLVAQSVSLNNARYSATSLQVSVAASVTPTTANVVYAIATGTITLNISGLPQGVNAAVTVSGPNSFSSVTASTVLEGLTPGQYTVAASNVTSGSLYQPAPPSQLVNVPASAEAVVVNVFYTSAGTALSVTVLGLPGTVPASVTVTGPNGSPLQLTSSQVLSSIPPGTYTVTAAAVTASCTTYTPVPLTQTVSVTSGQASSATVTYSSGGGGINLCIDGAYITQSVQAYDNSVPLVAGRDALLRVFVRASSGNAFQPAVRVRFYNGTTLANTITIQAPSASVPTTIDEATLGSSWNATLSGALLQPGLRMLIDVDPANAVAEGNETDNLLPANGQPASLDVRAVSTLRVRLVPVVQTARGDTGRVDDNNKANFIAPMMRMFPVASIDADVRQPYTYSGPELQSNGNNWSALLSEINATRVTEASGRSYYGLVRVGYTSGVAGLGYIGLPTAIGWDYQPSGTEVLAHEMGHNFGRLHAPCGNASGIDQQYPYSGATIGVYGYDILSQQLKFPALRDLMSYCDPPWISDYNYKAILNFRASNPMVASAGSSARGMLVWGRIDQGRLILEPAIEVDAPASLPARTGPHLVEGFGARGETLFTFAFAGDRVADAPDPNDETFAFVIPMSQLRGIDLDRLRLSARGRQVEQRSAGGGAIPSALRTTPGRVRVAWNAATSRVALIRDARTGQVLSFARGGAIDLSTTSDDLEITLSDGVKSTRSRLTPR
jgi:hypothetical protein